MSTRSDDRELEKGKLCWCSTIMVSARRWRTRRATAMFTGARAWHTPARRPPIGWRPIARRPIKRRRARYQSLSNIIDERNGIGAVRFHTIEYLSRIESEWSHCEYHTLVIHTIVTVEISYRHQKTLNEDFEVQTKTKRMSPLLSAKERRSRYTLIFWSLKITVYRKNEHFYVRSVPHCTILATIFEWTPRNSNSYNSSYCKTRTTLPDFLFVSPIKTSNSKYSFTVL